MAKTRWTKADMEEIITREVARRREAEDQLHRYREAGNALASAAYDVTDGRDGPLQNAIDDWYAVT